MPSTIVISSYDLRGVLVAQANTQPTDRELAHLLTPEQQRHLAIGLAVTVISKRGRTDYQRHDAAALRAISIPYEPDRRQGPDRRSALAAGYHIHRERRLGRDRRRAEQPC